ncbi:DNA mismatch repair protein MutL [Nitzschia inconspicua]|uniref:DNA mismatch repair protein MutL n=1 Tax=Nitzschia inconspicua TaxID=303405 RepID=A0A9K3KTB1_9STRA|nr:DNA mismatch repair protein MutL [Nitzschia inconspicua]
MHGLSFTAVVDTSSPSDGELDVSAPAPHPPPDSEIKRLSQDTIRRISAEQAISDLTSIVKELIDNALDAEATTIKIRLFQQGLHIIEVSDDGCGISPSSLPFIATRHATSKITSIDDIYSGTGLTMGFRGEALFSMACVSKELVVATKTEDDELATKMVFGKDGLPLEDKTEQFNRKVGTTVAVVNPYSSLPARLADLTRRIRNERTRIYKLIEAYGIFNVGVSFQLIDIGDDGVGTTLLQTSPNSQTLKETVSHLLTPTVLRTMKEVDISLDSMLERIYGENLFHWGIKGLLSVEPTMQQGAQQQDQQPSNSSARKFENRLVQFYSINGRVVELPKVTELLQKLWKAFGGKKKPRIILSLTLPNEAFDINLSPDKQTVLLTHEKELLSVLDQEVTKMWSNSGSRIFGVSRAPGTQNEDLSQVVHEGNEDGSDDENDDSYRQMHKRRFAFVHDLSNAKMQHDMDERQIRENEIKQDHGDVSEGINSSSHIRSDEHTRVETPRKRRKCESIEVKEGSLDVSQERPVEGGESAVWNAFLENQVPQLSDSDRRRWIGIQSAFLRSSNNERDKRVVGTERILASPNETLDDNEPFHQIVPDKPELTSPLGRNDERAVLSTDSNPTLSTTQRDVSSSTKQLRLTDFTKFGFQTSSVDATNSPVKENLDFDVSESVQLTREKRQPADDRKRQVSLELSSPSPQLPEKRIIRTDIDKTIEECEDELAIFQAFKKRNDADNKNEEADAAAQVVWTSFQSTQQICRSSRIERIHMLQRKRNLSSTRRTVASSSNFLTLNENVMKNVEHTGIEGNDENGVSNESPTSIRISKSSFRDGMKVIGQFNLGFILAICSQNQVWIFDQHACDEKTNFEHLCKKTIIHEQPLIRPLPLELSPAEEACVLDHMDIFKANGFRFIFDPNAPIRHRLSLTALPHSGAVDGQKAVQFGPSDVRSLCSILMEGSSYEPGDGGTGVDGSGIYGNNAVRRHASSASRLGHTQNDGEGRMGRLETADTILARLPKAIAMFASRACRTSIMIGTALSQREMNAVVKKLADLDMPFTCAHGRPTMNHVGDLSSVLLEDERRAAEYIATPTITMVPLSQQTEDV